MHRFFVVLVVQPQQRVVEPVVLEHLVELERLLLQAEQQCALIQWTPRRDGLAGRTTMRNGVFPDSCGSRSSQL